MPTGFTVAVDSYCSADALAYLYYKPEAYQVVDGEPTVFFSKDPRGDIVLQEILNLGACHIICRYPLSTHMW